MKVKCKGCNLKFTPRHKHHKYHTEECRYKKYVHSKARKEANLRNTEWNSSVFTEGNKKRKCLRCEKMFSSCGSGNRICHKCTIAIDREQ